MNIGIDINKLLELYGIKGLLIGVAIFFIYLMFKSEWLSFLWKKMIDILFEATMGKKKPINDKINENIITYHDIFNNIDYWILSQIPTLKFSTEYRTVVFRRYLTIYLKTYKSELKNYILKGDYKKMDESEFRVSQKEMVNRIINNYEIQCLEIGIPKIVIEKMRIKNTSTFDLYLSMIDSISNSNLYNSENNYLKLFSILNIVQSLLESVVSSSEYVCNSINGELKGLEFIENGHKYVE